MGKLDTAFQARHLLQGVLDLLQKIDSMSIGLLSSVHIQAPVKHFRAVIEVCTLEPDNLGSRLTVPHVLHGLECVPYPSSSSPCLPVKLG